MYLANRGVFLKSLVSDASGVDIAMLLRSMYFLLVKKDSQSCNMTKIIIVYLYEIFTLLFGLEILLKCSSR